MAPEPALNIFEKHNHRTCRASAIKDARRFCQHAGLRLTPVRARVLEILLETHTALGAYDILERLKDETRRHQPPVVYRALEFLIANGFVHRLERLNAFTACCCAGTGHEPMFLICQGCHKVAEAPLAGLGAKINAAAAGLGFQAKSSVVEILGRCQSCQTALQP